MQDPSTASIPLTRRLSCNYCGAHVLIAMTLHRPSGVCGVCSSYDLVPMDGAPPPRGRQLTSI
jgi:hypothetical protein